MRTRHNLMIAVLVMTLAAGMHVGRPSAALAAPPCNAALLPLLTVPPGTTLTSAVQVAATPTVPAFCRVRGTISPEPGSLTNFLVNLPQAWNGRFVMLGDGGHDGTVSTSTQRIPEGYATANSDSGHTAVPGPLQAAFAYNNRIAEIDYGYRSVHLTTVAAKSIIQSYYGQPIAYAYFDGCSTGGRQALMEAQRFPDDFDGIAGGDPAYFLTGLAMEQNWSMQQLFKDNFANNIAGKDGLIYDAVLQACDVLDGLADGLIDDPRRCTFDPASLTCQAGQDPATCLTPGQVGAVQRIYDGPSNSSGLIYQGKPRSSEWSWASLIIPRPGPPPAGNNNFPAQGGFVFDFMNYLFFEHDPGPSFNWLDFDFETDAAQGAFMAQILDATNPDLSAFRGRGGKFILYHGWADGLIPPFGTVSYYEQVVDRVGSLKETQEFIRLFMVPGMGHCTGGPGPNVWDKLPALVDWVEHGVAPASIVASHSTGSVIDRTRPLCPYPQVARYQGTGSIDDAASFACELKGLDRADQASGFEHGLQGRNNARTHQSR